MSSQTFKLILLDKDNEIIEKHSYGNVLENEVDIFIHHDTHIFTDDTIENI